MNLSYQKYPKEYRDGIVELARTGTSGAQLVRDFDPAAATIHNCFRKANGTNTPVESADAERRRKARELRDAHEEIAILKNAAAWFARDAVKIGSGSSRS